MVPEFFSVFMVHVQQSKIMFYSSGASIVRALLSNSYVARRVIAIKSCRLARPTKQFRSIVVRYHLWPVSLSTDETQRTKGK